MKKVIFAIMIIVAWILGIAEGDCTAAVMFSIFGACALVDKLMERRERRGEQ